jgi:phytanoyl-CoA hydroxylase
MKTSSISVARTLSEAQHARFREDGFLIVENLVEAEMVAALRDRFPLLFAGKFDTGIYPDEWYWREGISLPDATRHMANAWKSDITVAKLALSEDIGRTAAKLAGWTGARLGQDTIWWKPPGTKAVSFHQDSSFMDFLSPAQTITCWIALDDTYRDAGTLEYAPGSHRWPLTPIPEGFHAPEDYRALMRAAAKAAGAPIPEIVPVEVAAGSCVFHSGEIWHGSGPNRSEGRMRRAIGVHLIPETVEFTGRHGGYIYRRYQRTGDPTLDESFFPVIWSESRDRTPWVDSYCETGQRCNPD